MKSGHLFISVLVMLLCIFCAVNVYGESTTLEVKPGDTVILGRYEQDNKSGNGLEPIEWIVLETEEGNALLLSKYVLDCLPYNNDKAETTWANSSLRAWLNQDFYDAAFSKEEAGMIIEAKTSNGEEQQPIQDGWEGKPGENTEDRVWLLSYREIKVLLNTTKALGTEYANDKGAKAGFFGAEANWYTRSVGKKQDQATYMHDSFDPKTANVNQKEGIRPAIVISLTGNWDAFPYGLSSKAKELAEQKKYTEAYEIANNLGSYNNSIADAAGYLFMFGQAAMEENDYEEALKRFAAYSDYANEKQVKLNSEYDNMVPECYNELARKCLDIPDHEKAVGYYKELGEINASKAAAYWFDYAKAVMEKGELESALQLFQGYHDFAKEKSVKIISEYGDVFPDCYNQMALRKMEDGKHEEAYELYRELGSYSAEKAAKYWFDYATALKDKEEYDAAITAYRGYYQYATDNNIKVQKEYQEFLPECYYQMAIRNKDEGDYSKAIAYFSEIGQYNDVMEKLQECFDKVHTQYRWLTQNTGSVVNAGNKGYSEDKEITGNDPHFGWSLGRFMMSGFTEVSESEGMPIFVKTVGDNLTLWFDLDQDIDKLNGNKNLKIAKDTDGYDQRLNIQKVNMGRGALFLKHIDHRNSDSAPITYLDYLSAKESGVANTRVEIKEEGTYEVVLDYEIDDADLTHLLSKINNYRIAFRFVVKNGSAMFYIFDTGSGDELEDYSRTADGFKIDLANSHSLKVNVIRYALNQAANGLDVRSSGPASDGDTFDRTGYYEISVTNTETKMVNTKHIFVGSKGDLAEFKDVSSELDNFSEE